jgi:hypothetical protein
MIEYAIKKAKLQDGYMHLNTSQHHILNDFEVNDRNERDPQFPIDSMGMKAIMEAKGLIKLYNKELGIYQLTADGFKFSGFKNEEPKWTERNPILYDLVKGLITALFAISVSLFLGNYNSVENKRVQKLHEDRLNNLVHKVDSIVNARPHKDILKPK